MCCENNCVYCDDKDPSKCLTCLEYGIGAHNDRKCVDICPNNTYKYENRRCLRDKVCRELPKPVKANARSDLADHPFLPFNDQCVADCPPSYNVVEKTNANGVTVRACEPCTSECQKNCTGGSIMSIADAQQFEGCTRITGSLILQLQRQAGSEYSRTKQ